MSTEKEIIDRTINECIAAANSVKDYIHDNPGMGFNARDLPREASDYKKELIAKLKAKLSGAS